MDVFFKDGCIVCVYGWLFNLVFCCNYMWVIYFDGVLSGVIIEGNVFDVMF